MKHIAFAVLLSFAGAAFADCGYNGATYAEGTVIGPYVCSDGKWVTR
jgi:hypothetical protein